MRLSLLDGTVKVVKEVGDVRLKEDIWMNDVLYTPDFRNNLLSVSRLLQGNKMRSYFTSIDALYRTLSLKEK